MFIRSAATVVVVATVISSAAAQTTLLGVLEDVPGVYAGESDRHAVRVVFEKQDSEWRALPSACPDEHCLATVSSDYPREVVWNVVFDGRNLGQITARTPNGFKFYSWVGLQEIISKGPVPTVGQKSRQYAGYSDDRVYRPLVTNSQPYFTDPNSWRVSKLSTEMAGLLRRQYRRRFPKLCKLGEDQATLQPFSYGDNQIEVTSAYTSNKSWTVARLHLEGAIECGDTEAGFETDDKWFVVDPKQSVSYLDEGMWLVDTGDYDNDGCSELVFSIDRENHGGYELFYNDFKKRATFEYSYH
jgi:hypothetical protein